MGDRVPWGGLGVALEDPVSLWLAEHEISTAVSAQAIWDVWADVANWPAWNPGLTEATLDGAFDVGGVITMVNGDDDPIVARIIEAVPGRLFVDEVAWGDDVVRTTHLAEFVDGEGTRVIYRMEITGPTGEAVGAEIGPIITADFDDILDALVRYALLA